MGALPALPPSSSDYRDGGGGTLPAMLDISSHERRALRAQAHHLHPVVTIGQHGLTPTVLTEIDLALNAHGLIKVRVFIDDRGEREALFAEIADGLEAAPVQHIGKLFVLWRPQPEAEAEPTPAAPARARRGKTPAAQAREPARAAKTASAPVARRARGQSRAPATGRSAEGAATKGDGGRGQGNALNSRGTPRGPSAPNPRRRRGTR